jgi:hypothetical protein
MKPKIEVETKSYITMVKIMFNILLIICIFIFSNKYFFILSIKIRGFLFLKKNWLKELKLEFKNPIFLVSLPTNDYKLYTSLPKDFIVTYDIDNFLFPNFVGITVCHKSYLENKIIFYSKFSDITLNKSNLKDKKIEKLYIEYLLISKTNKNFIKQEVCRQLRERS